MSTITKCRLQKYMLPEQFTSSSYCLLHDISIILIQAQLSITYRIRHHLKEVKYTNVLMFRISRCEKPWKSTTGSWHW